MKIDWNLQSHQIRFKIFNQLESIIYYSTRFFREIDYLLFNQIFSWNRLFTIQPDFFVKSIIIYENRLKSSISSNQIQDFQSIRIDYLVFNQIYLWNRSKSLKINLNFQSHQTRFDFQSIKIDYLVLKQIIGWGQSHQQCS